MKGMILLITPSRRGPECASKVETATGHKTSIAETLVQATTWLRCAEYDLVVLDQHLVEAEPLETETVRAHLGTAVELEMNLALSGVERVVRAVQAGLARRKREESVSRLAAGRALYGELSDHLTRLLAECDLVSSLPEVSPTVADRLTVVRDQAQKLCLRLTPQDQSATN